MNILFCCEFYAPSVGGVQEVMKQLAERLVLRGHRVTVATSRLPGRSFTTLNGVRIMDFAVSGNLVRGMNGPVEDYRQFVISGNFDVIMLKAAQQWTFDALWPVLPQLKARKVFIPCGFSGLYDLAYADYFQQMPEILKQFDHLIFYASNYRDINLAKAHGLTRFSIIPNGAAEQEFSAPLDPAFRERQGIGQDHFVMLTVGSFTGIKGHWEVASAFAQARFDTPATLILNGNQVSPPLKTGQKLKQKVRDGLVRLGIKEDPPWKQVVDGINRQGKDKQVLVTNLPRTELIQAFLAADLFVFASNVEYSPLVLFEAAAAGTPFLSVPVGNAAEIAAWTGGGEICPAPRDEQGYTRADPKVLAEHITGLAHNPRRLQELGAQGRKNWLENYTWGKIVLQYEKVFQGNHGKGEGGK